MHSLPRKPLPQLSYIPVAERNHKPLSTTTSTTTSTTHTWQPGFMNRFPLPGASYLLLALLSLLSCVTVLASSNGQRVDSWPTVSHPIRPPVLLAILSALANFSLRSALWEALPIVWWRTALSGSTLAGLQRVWNQGTSVYRVLRAPRHLSLLGLATLLVSIVVIDGPLLQRASTTRMITVSHNDTIVTVGVATELVYGQTGFMMWTAAGPIRLGGTLLTPGFSQILEDYNYRRPIVAQGVSGCLGTCTGVIHAAGLVRECSETQDEAVWVVSDNYNDGSSPVESFSGTAFATSVGWSHYDKLMRLREDPPQCVEQENGLEQGGIDPDEPFIWMNVTYARRTGASQSNQNQLSVSQRVHRTCRLYAAARAYPVKIHNDTLPVQQGIQRATQAGIEDADDAPSESDDADTEEWTSVNTMTLTGPSTPLDTPFTIQSQRRDVAPLLHALNYNLSSLWFANGVGLFRGPPLSTNTKAYPIYDTLSGLSTAVQGLVGSSVEFLHYDASDLGAVVRMAGSMATQALVASSVGSDGFFGMEWEDPSDIILSILDELVFRCAVAGVNQNTLERVQFEPTIRNATGGGILEKFPPEQKVDMAREETVLVYESHYVYLGVSVAVMALAVSIVGAVFDRFWVLGRKTSLDPVEVAVAVGGEVVSHMPSNASEGELLAYGGKRVRYGSKEKRLVLGEDSIEPPVPGVEYY